MEGPHEPVGQARERLTGSAAMKAHITLFFGVALCLAAFWFELKRAMGGNELSWAYVFEWPLFALFAVYMWWKVLHPGSEEPKVKRQRRPSKPAVAPEYEGMLAAWQEHQAELAAQREMEAAAATSEDDA